MFFVIQSHHVQLVVAFVVVVEFEIKTDKQKTFFTFRFDNNINKKTSCTLMIYAVLCPNPV